MNITNIKSEIKNFMDTINANIVDMAYVPGIVKKSVNEYTGEEFEELTDNSINIVLGNSLVLNEEQNRKLAEFETYLYFSYHNLTINYSVAN